MIICDACKKKKYEDDTCIYRGYFYPREIMVEKPIVFDVCDDCMYSIFSKIKNENLKEIESEKGGERNGTT